VQSFDLIDTPETVQLERRLAGIGSRLIAGLLDYLLIILMFASLAFLMLLVGINVVAGFGAARAAGVWFFALLILMLFAIHWGYFVFFEMRTNGQTPGKKYMKIRVVQVEGAGISFYSIAIRNLLRAVDFLGFYAVAGIAMFVTNKGQRLGDLAAGTVVISEEVPDYSARYDKKKHIADSEAITAAALQATGLKPEEYRLLYNYWLRREELSDQARQQLLPQLVRPIADRMGHALVDGSTASLEEYVDDVVNKAVNAEQKAGSEIDGSEAIDDSR
jgi:uncharacterized RDD family membrane protein YckC